MPDYMKFAMKYFYPFTEFLAPYFIGLKTDLKKSMIKTSVEEYITKGVFLTFIIFAVELSLFSMIFSLLFPNFLFAFIMAFSTSLFVIALFFLMYINYPKVIIKSKAKDLENALPLSTLYLATIASSKLPLDKTLEIFSKFSGKGELGKEMNRILSDIRLFGVDVNTALEKGIERTPSKNFKEMLWGILSTNSSGGDMNIYLKEKSRSFMQEYRRKLYEFANSLSIYIEIYLTALVLGAIFFVILTAVLSGISGIGANLVLFQFFLIFVFLPIISLVFIFMIRSANPGGQ